MSRFLSVSQVRLFGLPENAPKPDTVSSDRQSFGPSRLSARGLPIPPRCCCALDTCGVLEQSPWRPSASFPFPPSPPARLTLKLPRGWCGSGANLRGQLCSPLLASCRARGQGAEPSGDPEASLRPWHRHGSHTRPERSNHSFLGQSPGAGL